MATNQEVIDALKKVEDTVDIQAAIDALTLIEAGAGGGNIDILIARDGDVFSVTSLLNSLDADDATQDAMVAAINAAVEAAIGPDNVTATTIRKALQDAKDAYDADIAAT